MHMPTSIRTIEQSVPADAGRLAPLNAELRSVHLSIVCNPFAHAGIPVRECMPVTRGRTIMNRIQELSRKIARGEIIVPLDPPLARRPRDKGLPVGVQVGRRGPQSEAMKRRS
jgi:hypothetical protein